MGQESIWITISTSVSICGSKWCCQWVFERKTTERYIYNRTIYIYFLVFHTASLPNRLLVALLIHLYDVRNRGDILWGSVVSQLKCKSFGEFYMFLGVNIVSNFNPNLIHPPHPRKDTTMFSPMIPGYSLSPRVSPNGIPLPSAIRRLHCDGTCWSHCLF